MNSRLRQCSLWPFALAAVLALPLALHAEAPKKIPALDKTSVVVTDFTDAGGELPVVSPATPAYIIAINAGVQDYGTSVIAGDPPPPEADMLGIIGKVLFEQGYRASDPAHPPTQIVVCSWGMIGSGGGWVQWPGPAYRFMIKQSDVQNPVIPGDLSALYLSSLAGRGNSTAMQRELSTYHVYAVLLRAFDLKAADEGKVVQLWETRIACSAHAISMKTALPRLVVSAQHFIGRETPQPIVENVARTRQGWVEYVPPTYFDVIETTKVARDHQKKAKAASEPKPE